ncbi:MAG: CDP-glycerol glycerophosphotransferase family protein [Paludibacteraceae bacterium]|nr:CDP-glycerol glycerophosphotransferase family protein [Paludibacteraceae bacterium]
MIFRKKIALRATEICLLSKLIIGKFLSLFYKYRKENIWLLSERGHEARDNAYFFFLYLKKNHPEVKAKYIISFDSKDFHRLSQYREDLVEYDSMEHYIMICSAKYLISTHIAGYTTHLDFFTKLDYLYNVFRNHRRVFLQHGITKSDMPQFYEERTHLDLFICGARPEYEYIIDKFHYAKGQVQYTGLCRYDNLNDASSFAKKQILLMPTWRMYIREQSFEETDYYKTYKKLLASPELSDILEKYDYDLVFYPHYEIQKHIASFKKLQLNNRIVIADFDYDVQTLLKESAALITDYSSVCFDMAYMYKPIIMFHFDKEEFYAKHYAKCYFEESNLGKVVVDFNTLYSSLEELLQLGCKISDEYRIYSDSFFEYRDNNNCNRVFAAINSLK